MDNEEEETRGDEEEEEEEGAGGNLRNVLLDKTESKRENWVSNSYVSGIAVSKRSTHTYPNCCVGAYSVGGSTLWLSNILVAPFSL
jgi:hypothetical protein